MFYLITKKYFTFLICVLLAQGSFVSSAQAFDPCATPSWEEFNRLGDSGNSTSRIKSFASRMKSIFSPASPQVASVPVATPQEQQEIQQQLQASNERVLAEQREAQRQAEIAQREKQEKARKFWQTMGTIAQVAGAVAGVVSESRNQPTSSSSSSKRNCPYQTCSIPGE